jgi:hypothetical protein
MQSTMTQKNIVTAAIFAATLLSNVSMLSNVLLHI